MNWDDFKQAAPDLAALGKERFERDGLVLVGTLRTHGWPRISPVEPLIVEGELYLGMSWQSMKARDLLRDARCTVHSVVSNRDGSDGEFKVYGRAADIQSPERRRIYNEVLYAKLGFRLEEGEQYHLFAVDIESAAFVIIADGEMRHQTWHTTSTPDRPRHGPAA